MNLDITFAGESVGSIKIARFTAGLDSRIRGALKKGGFYFEGQVKRSLKGSNPTTFFFKSPHAELRSRSGGLRRSINTKQTAMQVAVGPGGPPAKYGAIQDLAPAGGTRITVTDKMRRFLHARGIHLRASTTEIVIPQRQWFRPVWEKEKDHVIGIINTEIMRPIRE